MTADETRDALADVLAESRELMARSADNVRRSFDHRAAAARLTLLAEEPTQPARLALPTPATVPAQAPMAPIAALTSVQPFTERALATITGISLDRIAKAVRRKSIRTTRLYRKPRLLNVADTARWLTHRHGIDRTVLFDVN